MITLAENSERQAIGKATIKVVGVGGCGCNAINSLVKRGIESVELIAINTDVQSLSECKAPIKIQAGKNVTKGLGAGARPEIGKKAIEEVRDEITKLLEGSDLVFITAGMGKGTGTGGAPVVAEIAKSMDALVIGIVCTPSISEGSIRKKTADEGIKNLKEVVDTLIVISNQKLLSLVGSNDVLAVFEYGNEVLSNAVKGITDIIAKPGIVNVDFMDIRTIMRDMGDALLGTGIARGEHRATEAAQKAISNPLVEGLSIAGAKGVLINIVGKKVSYKEVDEAIKVITEKTGEDVNLIYGVAYDNSMNDDELMVTVIATGLESTYPSKKGPLLPQKRIRTVYEEEQNKIENLGIPTYLRKGIDINREIPRNEGTINEKEDDKPFFLRQVMD